MKLYILLLYICLIKTIIKAQFINLTPEINSINVSLVEHNPSFESYPLYTKDDMCQWSYNILVKYKTGNLITQIFSSDLNIVEKFISNNSKLYVIQGGNYINTKSINIIYINTTNSPMVAVQLNHTCNGFELNKINVEVLGNYPFVVQNTAFVSFLKIDGIPKSTFLSHDEKISVKKEDLPFTSDTTFYPTNLHSYNEDNGFNEFGMRNVPVFTSRVNSSIRPFNLMFSGANYEAVRSFTMPLKGSKDDITYSSIFSKGFDQINNYALYNQMGQNIQSFFFRFRINDFLPYSYKSISLMVNFIDNTTFCSSFQGTDYNFNEYRYYVPNQISLPKAFPFGFSGNSLNFTNSVCFSKFYSSNDQYLFVSTDYLNENSNNININTNPAPNNIGPKIVSYEFERVSTVKYLLKINIVSVNGVEIIKLWDTTLPIPQTLVNGDLNDGHYEILIDNLFILPLFIDVYGNSLNVLEGNIISIEPEVVYFRVPNNPSTVSYDNFKGLTFLYNGVQVSNSDFYNIAYLPTNAIPINQTYSIILLDPITISTYDFSNKHSNRFPFVYDPNLQKFVCKFIVKKNNIFDEIPYAIVNNINDGEIYFSQLLTELIVNNTDQFDNQGPMFSDFTKINGEPIPNSNYDYIGWRFTITDEINGFHFGKIKVMGSVDCSIYSFYIDTNDLLWGDIYSGTYQITITLGSNCLSQDYIITNVELYDTNGLSSIFKIHSYGEGALKNPFTYLYDQGINITRISTICTGSTLDPQPATLISFVPSIQSIDIGSNDRIVSFNFDILASPSGNKHNQFPIVYITSKVSDILECESTLISLNITISSYYCSFELPYGFGYPGKLLLSVSGILNNGGTFTSFGANDLYNYGFQHSIITTFSSDKPMITSTDSFLSVDTDLVIYGRGLSNAFQVEVQYSEHDYNNVLVSSIIGSSIVKVTLPKPTESPIKIRILTHNEKSSNQITIKPIYFRIEYPTQTPTSTPTQTPTPKPVTCSKIGNVLHFNSTTKIICIGYGDTFCQDGYESECSTDLYDSKVRCLTKSGYMSCTGDHVTCNSGYLTCTVNINQGNNFSIFDSSLN